jgi:phage baseplate assembly protein W
MAIILGRKLVKDTVEYNDYAYGITLPIQIGNTAFNQSFTSFEQAKTNIKNVLLTKKLERIMNPDFGSGLQELLFQMNDEILLSDVDSVIRESVERWLPYVSIDSIDINSSNELKDLNKLEVSISFRVSNNPNLDNITITV